MTVNEAFETFKSELELPDRKQQEAAEAQQAVREAIKDHLYVPNSFLTGSYAQQWERLGRAVPPPMMRAVAAEVATVLSGS